MNMVMNVIAVLLSLAMTLTGVGGDGQPAQAARNLVLHNITVSYNGETLRLGPQAHLGVSTDGEKAVYDFGVDLNDETLMPVQLGVSQEGVTALLGDKDAAVTVTAKAIEAVTEQLTQQLQGAMGEAENPELLKYITDEFMPAYAAMLNAVKDKEATQRIQAACQAVFDEKVDRGEGTPDTVEIEGEEYAVTAYTYAIENAQFGELVDALYTADPVLEDYYNAMFKLYAMMPEESGLRGLTSMAELYEKLGLEMRMDIDEKESEDRQIDVTDAVLTIDMNGMVQVMAQGGFNAEEAVEEVEEVVEEVVEAEADGEVAEEAEPEGDADEEEEDPEVEPEGDALEQLEPLVMNIHSVKVGEMAEAQVTCAYELDGKGFELEAQSATETGSQDMDMTMTFLEDGRKIDRCKLSAFYAEDEEGGASYSLSFRNILQDVSRFEGSFYGLKAADGTSENSFGFTFRNQDVNVDVSFDLDVTADAIEDLANGREDAYVIDDLSEEGIQALTEDKDLVALAMRSMASLSVDAGKLTQDKDIAKLMTLLNGGQLPIDVEDIDDEDAGLAYDIDGDDMAYVVDGEGDPELEFEDVDDAEDDGELGFEIPQFTWLPDGWTITSTDTDTAYDWVEIFITDEAGNDCAYALFFPDSEDGTADYVVQADGKVVEGRTINVADYGEGNLAVTLRDAGLYGNISFASDGIDVNTLGKIIAGIQFTAE